MSLYSYEYQKQQTSTLTPDHRIRRILIHSVTTLASLFLVLLSTLLLNNINNRTISPISASTPNVALKTQSEVGQTYSNDSKSVKQSNNLTISLTPTQSPSELKSTTYNLTPSPTTYNLTRNFYTVAIIGDSMVDTMGEVLEYLDSELKTKYPKTKFLLYNYGTGAQNIETGLARFGSHFKYQTRDYQSIPELKPDVLIVASFSYNPFTPHDRDRHWLTLTKLVEEAKQVTPRVYMLAEIAPLRKDFGKGPQGVNWSYDSNYEHSLRIIQQLENAVGLAKTLGVPLIDAFTPSFNSETREGKREYVNPSDGIHPSVEGHKFMAEKIAETLNLH
ncbi:hypothetical protein A2767_04090 [Candidatus Roizmanbacteria bacterium RIFCSPHIGHO2_01_FULL_35_10]|uniref:SGNH hydrolase-type esterase domain-containing protein n=1 Tax=Candidatus Roizmanbacteria bacterium RIFCSPLOWO2_01_FULL_35_13 TaxID=1802055 RepID=A0A1F7IH29_9BACT|nr:MAG: hypothetical protein A2767_04090 [Candidatus Roizmanbacteria bacterium RIFCSPHIGHO2_01_FULL_35_10]OGK42679.1 MAG: hypothetical protein A3A74_00025 [Candidatus Roizmanbacteria bacterium RIFCSPLOWO2_01_FULL_35_13]